MVRRKQSRGQAASKRPSQTLDLKAEELQQKDDKAKAPGREDQPEAKAEARAEALAGDKETKTKLSAFAGDAKNETRSEAAKDQQADAPSDEPSDRARSKPGGGGGSFLKYLAAAFLGAVLALGGQSFMPRLVERGGDSGEIAALRQAVEGLQENRGDGQLAGIKDELAELRQLVSRSDDEGLAARLNTMEALLADLTKTGGLDGKGSESLAALAKEMSGLESQLDQKIAAMKTEVTREVTRKVGDDVGKLQQQALRETSEKEFEGVRRRADTLGQRLSSVETLAGQLGAKFDDLSTKMASLNQKVITRTELDGELNEVSTRLTGLDGRLETLNRIEREAHETARRSALALALNNLKRSMARGEAFEAELEAVRKLTGGNSGLESELNTLSQFAREGMMSEARLIETFPQLAREAMQQEVGEKETGLWDKFVAKARHSFRFRRTGDIEGTTTEAVLARMEHQLKAGHNEQVLLIARTLEPKPARVMAPWVTRLKARMTVEKAIFKIEDQLKADFSPR